MAPSNMIDDIRNVFNSYYIKITVILEIGDRLNFLDTIIIVDNNKIIFDRFQKPICPGIFLNFHSYLFVKGVREALWGLLTESYYYLILDFTKKISLILSTLS